MRRIARHGKPVRRVALRKGQRQRKGEHRSFDFERAEIIGEPPPEFVGKWAGREREDAGRDIRLLGPDDRRAVAGHRQDREWAGGQETFLGDAAMRPLVSDGAYDSGLVVAPFDGAQPGGAPQRRVPAIGCDQQEGGEVAPIVERDPGLDRIALVTLDRPPVEKSR